MCLNTVFIASVIALPLSVALGYWQAPHKQTEVHPTACSTLGIADADRISTK